MENVKQGQGYLSWMLSKLSFGGVVGTKEVRLELPERKRVGWSEYYVVPEAMMKCLEERGVTYERIGVKDFKEDGALEDMRRKLDVYKKKMENGEWDDVAAVKVRILLQAVCEGVESFVEGSKGNWESRDFKIKLESIYNQIEWGILVDRVRSEGDLFTVGKLKEWRGFLAKMKIGMEGVYDCFAEMMTFAGMKQSIFMIWVGLALGCEAEMLGDFVGLIRSEKDKGWLLSLMEGKDVYGGLLLWYFGKQLAGVEEEGKVAVKLIYLLGFVQEYLILWKETKSEKDWDEDSKVNSRRRMFVNIMKHTVRMLEVGKELMRYEKGELEILEKWAKEEEGLVEEGKAIQELLKDLT